MKEHRERVKRPARRLLASLCVMMPLVWMNGTAAFGQTSDMPDLYRTKGKVIAEGKNTAPVGHYKVVSYRIEEVSLPKTVQVTVNGREVAVDRAYTVTLTGGPFPLRALPPIIWIDDTPLKWGQHSVDLSELTAVTYDRSLLREGAKISLSFGEADSAYTTLPENLTLNKKGGAR